MSIEKIKKLHDKLGELSEFEQKFVSDNFARIEKYAGDVKFSEKQAALVDRIYKERVEEGKAPKQAGE